MRVKQRPVPALFPSDEDGLDALGQGEADRSPQQHGTAPVELSNGSAGLDGAAALHGPHSEAAAAAERGAEEESEDAKDDGAAAGTVWAVVSWFGRGLQIGGKPVGACSSTRAAPRFDILCPSTLPGMRSILQDQEFTLYSSARAPCIGVPQVMMHACFPGVELPLAVQLRLEVDGHPWGAPWESRINRASQFRAGLANFPELLGCRVMGLRHEARPGGPPAITALLASVEAARPVADEWPMVSSGTVCVG
jgi:hypothetical protein